MLQKLIIVLVFCNGFIKAQSPKLSAQEFGWALVHPFAALKVKKITGKCNQFSSVSLLKDQLDNFSNGGKADAYRHTFFMAAYAQKIKIRKLRKLGKAHEKYNYKQFLKSKAEDGEIADSLSSVMDLMNNELGFILGSGNKKMSLEELSKLAVTEIKIGHAVIIKRDANGNYEDCSGNRLNLNHYKKTWFIPKCLITSDQR